MTKGITEEQYNEAMAKLEKLRKDDEQAKFKMPRGENK